MKRTIATLAAAGIALVSFAPPAHAQTGLGVLALANGQIATVDCGVVGSVLRGTGLVDNTTTRSQLITALSKQMGDDIQLRLIGAQTVTAIGDRALECGVVKPDPELIPGSSQLAQLTDLATLLSSAK